MCCEIKKRGGCILVVLTVLQIVILVGYSVLYSVVFKMWQPEIKITPTEFYQWITVFILIVSMVYFLWRSLKEGGPSNLKSPNELISYLAICIINNSIFLAKLCYYADKIKKTWIDVVPYPENPTNIQ